MRVQRHIRLLVLVGFLGTAITCPAPIQDSDYLTIDFANEEDARAKAEWSIPDRDKINEQGLGCDKKICSDSWIETKPLPIGLYWRPTSVASITVKIVPPPPVHAGDVFARYSPDCKHWSSWQQLSRNEKESGVGVFKGDLGVPNRERQRYNDYIEKYRDVDSELNDGEEAVVRWILQREPNFFEHTLPFIGYIQFLFEPPTLGPWHIKRFEVEVGWGISGFGSSSNDLKTRWRFKAP